MRRATHRIPLLPIAFAALAVLSSATARAASAYKCTRADGSVSFQDQPCSGAAKQQRLSLPNDPYVAPVAAEEQNAEPEAPATALQPPSQPSPEAPATAFQPPSQPSPGPRELPLPRRAWASRVGAWPRHSSPASRPEGPARA